MPKNQTDITWEDRTGLQRVEYSAKQKQFHYEPASLPRGNVLSDWKIIGYVQFEQLLEYMNQKAVEFRVTPKRRRN